jgi:hypothetical protein
VLDCGGVFPRKEWFRRYRWCVLSRRSGLLCPAAGELEIRPPAAGMSHDADHAISARTQSHRVLAHEQSAAWTNLERAGKTASSDDEKPRLSISLKQLGGGSRLVEPLESVRRRDDGAVVAQGPAPRERPRWQSRDEARDPGRDRAV